MNLIDFVGDGLCAQTDPEAFFNEQPNQWNVTIPKKVCASCDVREKCREWALEQTDLRGVWGGLTEKERLEIRMGRAA